VEPIFENTPANGEPSDEELLSLSWSLNEVRRHLSTSQRACAAAEIIERLPEEAKKPGPKKKGNSANTGTIARILRDFGTEKDGEKKSLPRETVRQARELLREAPVEFALVKCGKKTVADAHREHLRVKDATRQLHADAENRGRLDLLAKRHPDLAEKVQAGGISWEEAQTQATDMDREAAARMEGLHKLLTGIVAGMSTIVAAGKHGRSRLARHPRRASRLAAENYPRDRRDHRRLARPGARSVFSTITEHHRDHRTD
jgi:hypothetical protein